MSEKSNGRPAPAKADAQPILEKVNGRSLQEWLEVHPGWSRKSNALVKEYRLASFRDSIVFVNRIAGLADSAQHHPDIDIRFNRVLITLSTHDVGGITAKDLALAESLDHATSAS
ncbi:MAG: 4a-hydroxytetrahydrobiopterin dehydratase [Gemmatimonadetes bacterium]|nr:4a-hydroxytetrahydrobiopterin dehydratase [Gemmatimonadota bacterium]